MRIRVLVLLVLLLPTASAQIQKAELKHGDTYHYEIQQMGAILLSTSGLVTDFWLGFYLGGQDKLRGGTTISQGSTFTLIANQTVVDQSINTVDLYGNDSTMLPNITEEWNSLWVKPSVESELFSLHTDNGVFPMYDGYDSQGFFVDQTAFQQFAGNSYRDNGTVFWISKIVDENYTPDGTSMHHVHTEYSEYYQTSSGMLLEFSATRSDHADIPNGTAGVRQMNIHIVTHIPTTTRLKISYHPMFIALLPLVLLRRKRVS